MSLGHHDPDLAVVGCVACGDLVDEVDVVHDTAHFSVSCCYFHPYHSWCYRAAPPGPRRWTVCADCGAELASAEVLEAARWLAGFNARLHGSSGPEEAARSGELWNAQRPSALRFVRVRWPGSYKPVRRTSRRTFEPLFNGRLREIHAWLGRKFEIAHASGCMGEPAVVSQLRASPGDLDLRLAYADELERAGDAARVSFVRRDAARRRGERFDRQDERLRNIRASLPSSWREAVVRRRAAHHR